MTTTEVEKVRFASEPPTVVAHANGGATVTLRLEEEPHQLVSEVIESWPCPEDLIRRLTVTSDSLIIEVKHVEQIAMAVEWLLLLEDRESSPIAQMVNRARRIEAARNEAEPKLIEFLKHKAILDK